MILAADSVMPPSAAQIAAAKAAGYGAWLGGFAGPNILYGWADADFQRVIAGGLLTGAYCSRLADPLAMKARAAGLGIVLIQDDESGIAPFDIAATDAFLVASGASLYGGSQVMSAHYAHAHPAYVYAGYPGGVQTTTWPPGIAAPPQPKGWQWANATLHPQPFGSVDTSNFEAGVFQEAFAVSGQFQGSTSIEHEAYIGSDGNLWHGWRDADPAASTSWGWENLGAPPNGCADSPEYLCNAAVTIQVVRVRDAKGALWCRYGTLAWGGWTSLGNIPAAVGPPPGAVGPAGPPGADAVLPATATVTGTVKLS